MSLKDSEDFIAQRFAQDIQTKRAVEDLLSYYKHKLVVEKLTNGEDINWLTSVVSHLTVRLDAENAKANETGKAVPKDSPAY